MEAANASAGSGKRDETLRMSAALGRVLVRLISVIGVLALPADAQTAVLRHIGTAPNADELGMEFGDLAAMSPQFTDAGWLTESDVVAIRVLDDKLSAMSGTQQRTPVGYRGVALSWGTGGGSTTRQSIHNEALGTSSVHPSQARKIPPRCWTP